MMLGQHRWQHHSVVYDIGLREMEITCNAAWINDGWHEKHTIILFITNGLVIWHGFPDIRHFDTNNWCNLAIFIWEFKFFRTYHFLKLHILLNSNGLAIWHNFWVITHIKVKSSCKAAILNLMKLKLLRIYPYQKLHNMFNSYCIGIWHVFPVIRHIKVNKTT